MRRPVAAPEGVRSSCSALNSSVVQKIPLPWVDHPYGEEEITLLEEGYFNQ